MITQPTWPDRSEHPFTGRAFARTKVNAGNVINDEQALDMLLTS